MINRIQPVGPVQAYQTYNINQPADVTVVAACEQVACDAWLYGWQSVIDESDALGKARAHYIRHLAGRTFVEKHDLGGLTVFVFEAHQRCFAEHRTRPEIYARRDGDWRGNPTGRVLKHASPADWVEDMGEHLQNINDQIERG